MMTVPRSSAGELAVLGVEVSLGGRRVLRDLSVTLRPGEVTVLVGPNGAGKSTLLRLLTRVRLPDVGSVSLAGKALGRWSRRDLARELGVVPQESVLPEGYTVFELVMMGRAPYIGLLGREGPADLQAVERALLRARIETLAGRRIEQLSGGERRRVVLARALAQTPSWLLLDEPTNDLDIRHQVDILRFVLAESGRGLGVLLVLHDLNIAARVADRVLLMDSGEIRADGPPQDVLTEAALRSVYEADVRVHRGPEGLPVILPVLGPGRGGRDGAGSGAG